MTSLSKQGTPAIENEALWRAVSERRAPPDDEFVYAVKTTGIYCRPVCPSRAPNRSNVVFYAKPSDAEAAGFRACLRCRPNGASIGEAATELIAKACRAIENAEVALKLDELAALVGMSAFHFHRLFKTATGLTPREYGAAHRVKRMRAELTEGDANVTTAIYNSGFNSSSRFYERSSGVLGMTPTAFKQGGKDIEIHFAIAQCSLGAILVARSMKGVCAITIGEDPDALARDVQDRFPNARLIGADPDFERLVAQVVGFVEEPRTGLDLPLDVRGSAFEQRVWQALRDIPVGKTASYSEIARRIGEPGAARAIARACAANTIAVAIPCHRVVRKDGALSGYRWGVERKRALLEKEQRA